MGDKRTEEPLRTVMSRAGERHYVRGYVARTLCGASTTDMRPAAHAVWDMCRDCASRAGRKRSRKLEMR